MVVLCEGQLKYNLQSEFKQFDMHSVHHYKIVLCLLYMR